MASGGGLRLLAHVTYFDRSGSAVRMPAYRRKDAPPGWRHDPTAAREHLTGWPDPRNKSTQLRKTDPIWREHVYRCLLTSLSEMERSYHMFDLVHVVINANRENGFLVQLREFARSNDTQQGRCVCDAVVV